MAILWARFIANAITFYILWNYITSQLRRYDSQGHKLDKDQVIDNIKNDRRFDWGTGEEENWRHKWNPRHPVERKPVTLFGIVVKSFLLYYVAGTIIEVILSILVYTFFSRMFDLMLPPVAKHSIVVA